LLLLHGAIVVVVVDNDELNRDCHSPQHANTSKTLTF